MPRHLVTMMKSQTFSDMRIVLYVFLSNCNRRNEDLSSSVKSMLVLQKAYVVISKCFSSGATFGTVSLAINRSK